MAFWGVFVEPGQPYTLQLEGDQKRLRISQATLGERSLGIWTSRSSLQCAVGSKPPVFICSVSNEMPCCRLDLEFEESEEVVFSIRGPRGIHLSGYYVTPHAAERATTISADDPGINCNGEEEISNAKKEKGRELSLEEEDIGKTDSLKVVGEDNSCNGTDGSNYVFADASACLLHTDLQELNASVPQATATATATATAAMVSRQSSPCLSHGDQISDGNMVNNIKQQDIHSCSDSFLGRKDEHVFCAKKSGETTVDMIEKDGEKAENMTSELNNSLDTGTDGIGSKEKADSADRLNGHESEEHVKEIIGECWGLRTLDADIGHTQHIGPEGDKAPHTRSESNVVCQEGARTQQSQESSRTKIIGVPPPVLPKNEVSSEIGQKSKKKRRKHDKLKDLPGREDGKPINDKFSEETDHPNNLLQSPDISNENSQRTKKRKRGKLSRIKSLDKDNASFDDIQDKIEQRGAINRNVLQVLPESGKERKPTCDKDNEIYSHEKKKKQKIKGEEDDENLHAKSSKVRTLSNGLIIEELIAGKPDAEVAVPGKKVKIFYVARLLDSGYVVESNVGQAPFKFRIGDEKIVKGWNIGVSGMRIGEKRKLTIPPSMGYGKRFVDVIPRNSWLVCEIELVSVR